MNSSQQDKIGSIIVLIVAALLLEATTAVQYFSIRNAISENVAEMAQNNLTESDHTAQVKQTAETAINQALPEVERLLALGQEDSLHMVLQQIVKDHKEIVGVDFAHRVGEDGVRNGYFTFVEDSTGQIADTIIGFDYTERSWYREGIKSDGFWSEPYMSRYYVALMSTYARAVRDGSGKSIAVIGADIPMWQISSMTVKLYNNQQKTLVPVISFQLLGLLFLAFIISRNIRSIRRLAQANSEQEFMNRELQIANHIQAAMLPTAEFSNETIDVAGSQVPAKQVGGDFFDYFVRDNKLFFNIGDVCGKGMPAALIMSMTQAIFRSTASREDNAAVIVQSMNDMACRGNDTGMFATLFVGVLDLATGQLQYSNAGHEKPIVITGKQTRRLDAKAHLPIGVMEETAYHTEEAHIEAGEMIMLYTDGLTEAMNGEEKLFGLQRVLQTLSEGDVISTPKQLLDTMSKAVSNFVRGAEQSDDLTMLAILYKGK